ncbi:MAG: D-alanyl-D-alanine carboxypeptidase, partial [Lachnospiraceae bacterium]|nr:D-alanyl-D-alanine carboxypeptidase [Lachnospiraceae bacterium]
TPASQTQPAQAPVRPAQTQTGTAVSAAPVNVAALAPYRDTLPYGSVYDEASTAVLGNEVGSTFAILVNADTNQVVAWKNGANYMNPASMSKIMTVLIACENADPNTVCTVPQSVVNYCNITGISAAGFSAGEQVTVRDLMYATMLASGADSAMTLASAIGGSEAGFAQLMNNKLTELGLSGTAHFNNSVGLYQPGHFCTVYDMAVIMEAALSNPVCREILTAQTYTTTATAQHPSGIALKNSFLEQTRSKTAGTEGLLLSARSGYVKQSGCCAVSAFQAPDGQLYVCVTGNTTTQDNAGFDHAYIYKNYVK